MSSTTTNINQEPLQEMVSHKSEANFGKIANKLVFLGIVILGVGSWLAIVNYMSQPLITPSLASSSIIFFAAVIHLLGNPKTKNND